MIANLYFVQRNDCFCHVKSNNMQLNTGSILQITSTLSNQTIFVTCKSTEHNQNCNTIEVSGLLGWHSNLKHNEEILVNAIPNTKFHYGDTVNLVPLTNDEWDLIEKNSNFIEQNFLQQICCLRLGMVFPIWVKNLCLLLNVESMSPSSEFCIVTTATTLSLNPNSSSQLISSEIPQILPKPCSQIPSNQKSLNKTKKKSILKSFFVILDFVHFLIFGKSFKQKRKEKEIFEKWESDLQFQSDMIFDQKFYGRCYWKSDIIGNGNLTLTHLEAPIVILFSHLNVINRDLFKRKLMLAKIEKVPFSVGNLKANKNIDLTTQFVSFIQISESSDLCENSVRFILPINLWKEYNFHVGDRAACTVIGYEGKSIKKLSFSVETQLNPILIQQITDSLKQKISCVQNDYCPLLIRQNMKIPLTFGEKELELIATFKYARNLNIDNNYCVISNYFLQNSFIDIEVKNEIRHESNAVESNNKSESEWFDDNPIYKELLLKILDENDNRSRNILIYGPTGIGKSLFCHKLCLMVMSIENLQYFVSSIDCRDLLGKQLDSIKKKIFNTLLEARWRAPSIICFDNLDSLIPNIPNDETHSSQIVHGELLASTMKYAFEVINKLGWNSKVITISTCRSIYSLHNVIMRKSFQSTILFKHTIDFSVINKNIFMTVVDKCLKEIETNNIIDTCHREEILSRLKSNFGVTENFCGFDAVAITKNAIVNAIKRAVDNDEPANDVKLDLSDLDHSLVTSSSYQLSNLSKRQRLMKISFRHLYGLDYAKNILRQTFIWPSEYSNLFKKSPIKLQQGVLLYGLPGSGKTHLAIALSNEVKMNFQMIKGPELLSKYIGASEEQVRKLFENARKNQPMLLFFDEFDSLAPRRGHDNTGVTDRVVNQLLTEIDGISDSRNSGIFILAASNRPDLIDPAILRPGRINGRIHCKNPSDVKERVDALKFFLNQSKISVANQVFSVWDFLDSKLNESQWMYSYSFVDLLSIVNQSENKAVMRFTESETNVKCEINLEDFQNSVADSRPSLTADQIYYYQKACEEIESNRKQPISLKSKITLA